jgi:hypothetical protein
MFGIEIADSGPGIPPDRLPLLFGKFSQLEAKSLGLAQSTGLGLAFCKLAAEAHPHGRIGAWSEVGIGSSFFFELPLGTSQKSNHSGENALLSPQDLAWIAPYAEQIRQTPIFDTGAWHALIQQIRAAKAPKGALYWADCVEDAIYAHEEERLRQLIQEIAKLY